METQKPLIVLKSRFLKILSFIDAHPLARKNKLKSYFRFFYWQISQRLYPREATLSFTSLTKLVVKRHLIGATGNIYAGLHDFSEMGFLLHFLRKEDRFADIGANVGTYSVLASGHVGASTLAFEPMPKSLDWIKKNIAANNMSSKVTLFPCALGDAKTTVRFSSSLDAENHVIAEGETLDETLVQVERFDDLCYPSMIPSLVKIDVEGYETAVLKGMELTLANHELKAIIIELNGSGYRYDFDERAIHSNLVRIGFNPYLYDPFTRSLTALSSFGPNNTVYIRDLEFVQQRVQSAEPIRVNGVQF